MARQKHPPSEPDTTVLAEQPQAEAESAPAPPQPPMALSTYLRERRDLPITVRSALQVLYPLAKYTRSEWDQRVEALLSRRVK